MDHVQTKREIQEQLIAAGLRPRKRFGQHFLIDGNLMRRLVESAEIGPTDIVLEVGPGTGGLTDLLVDRAARLICVEIDRDLCAIMEARFKDRSNFQLICGDALAGKHELSPLVTSALAAGSTAHDPRAPNPNSIFDIRSSTFSIKLVANLPYDVATPLLINLLLDYPQVQRFCFTVQAEVGDRIVARPGSKTYGPLSIISQTLARVQQVARIGPSSFWPRPQVDSVMLRMDRVDPSPLSPAQSRRFAEFVHGVFEHRRKTLRAALAYVVDDLSRERICSIIDAKLRPEQIDRLQWLELFASLKDSPKNPPDGPPRFDYNG